MTQRAFVPNILDRLDAMLQDGVAQTAVDRLVLVTARDMCAELIRTKHHPPSWPLNLDEWEVVDGRVDTNGEGWWMLDAPNGILKARRRQSRPELPTLTEEN